MSINIKKLLNRGLDLFLSLVLRDNFYFVQYGVCPCCDKMVLFRSKNSWLRDNFFCTNCSSIPRERALILTIEKYYPQWRTLSIHESSPGNQGSSIKLQSQCSKYTCTHYYPGKKAGEIVDGSRNENLEAQTFPDESFDLVITQDVFEHIYEPDKAFKEIARTLKKNGAHIFTVPLVNKHNQTEKWAVKGEDGFPVFLSEPEYHYNPIDTKGSPVTMHWGYDIINFIKRYSNLDTIIETIDDLNHGVRAEYIDVLVSQKK